jgi:hypothetical protein
MCELFAMSAQFPTTVRVSFDELARHGGEPAPIATAGASACGTRAMRR